MVIEAFYKILVEKGIITKQEYKAELEEIRKKALYPQKQ
jgi:hypothetical protein